MMNSRFLLVLFTFAAVIQHSSWTLCDSPTPLDNAIPSKTFAGDDIKKTVGGKKYSLVAVTAEEIAQVPDPNELVKIEGQRADLFCTALKFNKAQLSETSLVFDFKEETLWDISTRELYPYTECIIPSSKINEALDSPSVVLPPSVSGFFIFDKTFLLRAFAHEVKFNKWTFCDPGTIAAAKKYLVGIENFKFQKAQLELIQTEFYRQSGGTPAEIVASKYFDKITCTN